MTMLSRVLLAGLLSVLCLSPAFAENWPQWRGPALNGSSTEAGLPDKIGKADNLAWVTPLPGPGAGTPIIWNDRVFVSAIEKGSKKLLALCYSLKDGKQLWSREMGLGFAETNMSDVGSQSALTDGKLVVFYFGTGDLAAFDLAGQPAWQRSITKDFGPFNVMWIYGSSPLLYQGKLYIQVLHRDQPYGRGAASDKPADSYLLGVDPATGKDLFRVVRPSAAQGESRESYATPIPYVGPQRTEILVVGGDCLSAHDPATGAELWRWGTWNPTRIGHWRIVPSPVLAGDLAIVCAPKRGPVFGIKTGGTGDVSATAQAWKTTDATADAPTPLFYQGRLYVLDGDNKFTLTCLDPKTGTKQWAGELGGKKVFRASPTGADGKIYCMNEGGEVWVLAAGDQFKVLSQAALGEGGNSRSRASVSVGQGRVLVRTAEKLWAFGK